jgi:two-component system, LytTR family, sensor kinase
MEKAWTPPVRLVFAAATLLGIFSTLQAYRLTALNINDKMNVDVWRLLLLNLAYWYVPAALTSPIFRIARRFRIDSSGRVHALTVHALAALTFSVLHLASMMGVRALLWPGRIFRAYASWTSLQDMYLRNLDWALMTYSTIVGLSYALGYYQESQARAIGAANLEARLAQARLRTLEAELHPHFLFNTLHAISTLVHTQPDAADRMISRLSDLLRITFSRSGAACVPLHEELEFLQKYLEIEQTRFQDRLTVEYEIDPETLDAEVPRLILQPLVENAIKHGVAPRTGPGRIAIGSRTERNQLHLTVRDNGAGLSSTARAGLHGGVGLSNTRDRLECLYGTAQALDFFESADGLSVEMRLPFRHASAATEEAATQVA